MKAHAYLRVSGKSQIEGDGFARQIESIQAHARTHGITIVGTFREEGVTGASQWDQRPAFQEMILADPEVKVVIVENLTRLAREFMIQETILLFLASKGIDLISADTGENVTEALRGDPMKKALIQMQAVFSELEKNSIVRKLRVARERKKLETGRCEGQKPFGALPGESVTLERIAALSREGMNCRAIAMTLNSERRSTRNGRKWHFATVAKILSRISVDEPSVAL